MHVCIIFLPFVAYLIIQFLYTVRSMILALGHGECSLLHYNVLMSSSRLPMLATKNLLRLRLTVDFSSTLATTKLPFLSLRYRLYVCIVLPVFTKCWFLHCRLIFHCLFCCLYANVAVFVFCVVRLVHLTLAYGKCRPLWRIVATLVLLQW
jgi:hypothetical protein